MMMIDGTRVTMMNTGMKHSTIGKTSLTPSLAAFSSVRCVMVFADEVSVLTSPTTDHDLEE